MNVMHVEAKQGRADKDVTDLLVLLLSQGETILKQEAASINTLLGGHLQTLLEQREFEGKANETLLVHTQGKTPAKRVLLVGVGAKKELRLDSFRQAMGSAVKRVRQAKVTTFTVAMPSTMPRGATALEIAQATAEGAILGNYQFNEYRTENGSKAPDIERLTLYGADRQQLRQITEGVRRGTATGTRRPSSGISAIILPM